MTYEIAVEDRPDQQTAVVVGRVTPDGIPEFLGQAFGEVLAAVGGEAGVAGPPFARYDIDGPGYVVEAGFPVPAPIEASGRVRPSRLRAGQVAVTMHVGPYDEVAGAYTALETWLEDQGLVAAGRPWETYLDRPDVPQPRTLVCWPVLPG